MFDINIDFAHNKLMNIVVILTGIFLAMIALFCPKKFTLYGLLTTFVLTILSIELLADISGITLCTLIALSILNLLSIKISLVDILGCIIIALPCIFWLGTDEFVDGFAYSYIFIGIGIAIVGNLLFAKQKRQTLCALALLTSFVVCYMSNVYISTIDIALSFLTTVIFTEYPFENSKKNAISQLKDL